MGERHRGRRDCQLPHELLAAPRATLQRGVRATLFSDQRLSERITQSFPSSWSSLLFNFFHFFFVANS
jgi:hypothetical protein